MKIVVLDSTADPRIEIGPGSGGYFSRHVIRYLARQGHDITLTNAFDVELCGGADVVWSEWCNEIAYEAAASGACKRLLLRMRGYDVWGPLYQLAWKNVHALVYESAFLREIVPPFLRAPSVVQAHVIPSGVDVTNIPFRMRHHGLVVALVARAVADKGFQLAFEWARQRPDIQLHVALAFVDANSRLVRYLAHTQPSNVTIHDAVDTVPWLDEIDANYLLSASNWESLGYTIAEAMAMGIKPLIHDTPGAVLNWGPRLLWRSFEELNEQVDASYDSVGYRDYVLQHLDAAKQSVKFANLLTA